MTGFTTFFKEATGFAPYEWQIRIAEKGLPDVLSVPTGLGKTEGFALAWAWRLAARLDGRPFDEDEQTAILRAASRELSWATAGPEADAWRVRVVPLDRAVPAPPGFDGAAARLWESVTPYVPPRHHLRGGKLRDRESLVAQIRRELALRGLKYADQVELQQIGAAAWVAVHVPRRQTAKLPFLGDRRGYLIRLAFPEPIQGPLRVGHSSSFGLGLFRPIDGNDPQ